MVDDINSCIYKHLMRDRTYQAQESLGFLTITTNRLMSAFLRKQLVESGIDLTAEQWGVLSMLWERGSIAQEELAYFVCVDKSSMSRVLDVMERRGLVTRRRDPGDARRKILFPTPAAERFKTPCYEVAASCMELMLRGVAQDEHRVCLKILNQVKRNLRALSEQAPA